MNKQYGFRIVAISDTHSCFRQFQAILEKNISGDFFIFGGDFTRYGNELHFRKFISFLERLNFRHKIVIAGNHEISLDGLMQKNLKQKIIQKYPCSMTREQILAQLQSRCIYLEHELVQIEGIKIFGSPYTLKYSKGAFQYPPHQDETIWNTLPHEIDILITHSPPFGILDMTAKEKHAGSVALRWKVSQIRPKLHIFGHIHESHGVVEEEGTVFMNVAKKYEQFQLK